MTMRKISCLLLFFVLAAAAVRVEAVPLLQSPAISRGQVAFSYAGDLWVVGREGGKARRLTTGIGLEVDPVFSPDGRWIAFTGQYEGNFDIYLVPADGGVPRRLTYHPGVDRVAGWTPDGTQVLFRSQRTSFEGFNRLFTVTTDGKFPSELPLPMGEQGSYSADGARLAYVPRWNFDYRPNVFRAWKRYRGGLASPIWIARLSDSSVEPVPRQDSNDYNPMWVGDRIYFLSDRDGSSTLYVYEPASRQVTRVIENDRGPDILSAAAAQDAIVYEQAGRLYLLDLGSGRSSRLDIQVDGDLPSVRPRFVDVAEQIATAGLSPTGVRAVFEAHGEILTVPADKGDIRNLTQTPGVAERDPAWSPDGKWIAYFSDESGEYALHLRDQTGAGEVKKIALGDPPSFFYAPRWSPDSRKLVYTDKRLNVWWVDVDKGKPVRVDTDYYESPFRLLHPVWSPDSRWIAYTRQLPSHLRAVFVYSLETGKARQLTDGMSDTRYAAFDKSGRYLFFTASTDVGPTSGWLDMSSYQRPVSRSVYVAVLDKTLPSPLAPRSDEEKAETKAKEEEGEEKAAEPVRVKIDFDGIDQRILALPIPPRTYSGLTAGKAGVLFLQESAPVPGFGFTGRTLHRFNLEELKTDVVNQGIGPVDPGLEAENNSFFAVSHDGESMLYTQGGKWYLVPTAEPPKDKAEALDLAAMQVRVEPREEWRQMYREAWRMQRDFFYDPELHGLDLKNAMERYQPYLDDIGHRNDLNYLFNEMLGELTVGHLYIGGGDAPEVESVPGGLLGADYEIDDGRYRFKRVYNGENWNPGLVAPLTQPGVNVAAGEYLLAVSGRELRASDNLYSFFEGTAGKSVVIKVGPRPDGQGAREVTVVPIPSEGLLRLLDWVEGNRRKVDKLSDGRLAYVYLPNTGVEGYTFFNRYYFAQVGRDGAVLDERFNGGGYAADYIIDYLRRPLLNYWATREGEDFTTPVASIYGPKVMVVNGFAGSGGDAMPWYFRRAKIGPLVGTRTWGGLVGVYDYPQLIDGGSVTAPRVAFWTPEAQWEVENRGVAPDIEVDEDPKAWREGRDPQLEKAVEVALELLRKNPVPKKPNRPEYPKYPQRTAGGDR